MLQSSRAWRHMIKDTEEDSLVVDRDHVNSFWSAFVSALTSASAYADSLWKRSIAAELLSMEYSRKGDTTAALAVLGNIIQNSNDHGAIRRAMLRTIYLRFCIMHDFGSAYAQYLALERQYSRTAESVYAKILLRMDPDSSDWAAMRKIGAESQQRDLAGYAVPSGLKLGDLRPNPMGEVAALDISSETEMAVDIFIYDLNGRLLRKQHGILLPAGIHTIWIERRGLAPGSYLLSVTDGTKGVATRFMVSD